MPPAVPRRQTLIRTTRSRPSSTRPRRRCPSGANALRDVRERYRTAYLEKVERWERLRALGRTRTHGAIQPGRAPTRRWRAARSGVERSVLGRIDLAAKSLENAWLFLAREDSSLVSDPSGPPSAADAQMRIVEAQEQERTRLAREVHDGPAQALSNAIFQVEVVQRLLDRDEQLARAGAQAAARGPDPRAARRPRVPEPAPTPAPRRPRPQRRDPGGRRPDRHRPRRPGDRRAGRRASTSCPRPSRSSPCASSRKRCRTHASTPSRHRSASGWRARAAWAVEVRDDGKGFDADEPAVSERRHFGLQFMRERAELIGARFEVRSSPNLGTAVRMTIPPGAMGMPIPGEES